MAKVKIPNNWAPRDYQLPLWEYLQDGGKRAAACWHRRAGKDDIGLNWSAVSSFERPANYWHMLPEYAQARKAIWEAVDPHTGIKRIDQAFPRELRRKTNDHEMFIEFVSGASWRVVGSDRFDSLVGAGPAGIVFSEWSLSNPRAWGVLGPMLEENKGWALFIYTARGQNHGAATIDLGKQTPGWFSQVLKASDTTVFTADQLSRIRAEYIALDSQNGESLFEQEYECNFGAAVHGAYWAKELARAETEGRVCDLPADTDRDLLTAWDLGVSDATSIWFFQTLKGGLHVVDFYEASGVGADHYANVVHERAREHGCRVGTVYVPHDAKVKEWGSGRTRIEQLEDLGFRDKIQVVADHRLMDGIGAARQTLATTRFDKKRCAVGINLLKHYHAEYDEERKVLKPTPKHDFSSHAADAWRYLSMGWQQEVPDMPLARVRRSAGSGWLSR